jgi:hypothetical protein
MSKETREYKKEPTLENLLSVPKSNGNAIPQYSIEDFYFCTQFGKVPNSRMITLLRYDKPVNDWGDHTDNGMNVELAYLPGNLPARTAETKSGNAVALLKMITYLGAEAENSLDTIIKSCALGYSWSDATVPDTNAATAPYASAFPAAWQNSIFGNTDFFKNEGRSDIADIAGAAASDALNAVNVAFKGLVNRGKGVLAALNFDGDTEKPGKTSAGELSFKTADAFTNLLKNAIGTVVSSAFARRNFGNEYGIEFRDEIRVAQDNYDPYSNGIFVNKNLNGVNYTQTVKRRSPGGLISNQFELTFQFTVRDLVDSNTGSDLDPQFIFLNLMSHITHMTSSNFKFFPGKNRFTSSKNVLDLDPIIKELILIDPVAGFMSEFIRRNALSAKNIKSFINRVTGSAVSGILDNLVGSDQAKKDATLQSFYNDLVKNYNDTIKNTLNSVESPNDASTSKSVIPANNNRRVRGSGGQANAPTPTANVENQSNIATITNSMISSPTNRGPIEARYQKLNERDFNALLQYDDETGTGIYKTAEKKVSNVKEETPWDGLFRKLVTDFVRNLGWTPTITGIKPLLLGKDVGEWRLIVGNPFNPILSIGNLVCVSSNFSIPDSDYSETGFPTRIKCKIQLAHGRPRDRRGFQNMFGFVSVDAKDGSTQTQFDITSANTDTVVDDSGSSAKINDALRRSYFTPYEVESFKSTKSNSSLKRFNESTDRSKRGPSRAIGIDYMRRQILRGAAQDGKNVELLGSFSFSDSIFSENSELYQDPNKEIDATKTIISRGTELREFWYRDSD